MTRIAQDARTALAHACALPGHPRPYNEEGGTLKKDIGPILRRGLVEHMKKLKGAPLATFILLILEADYRNHRVAISVRDIAEITGYDKNTIAQALQLLKGDGYIVDKGSPSRELPRTYFIPKYSLYAPTKGEPPALLAVPDLSDSDIQGCMDNSDTRCIDNSDTLSASDIHPCPTEADTLSYSGIHAIYDYRKKKDKKEEKDLALATPLPIDETSDPFEDFWTSWPKKTGKQAAARAWAARLNEGHRAEDMIAAGRHYAQAKRGEPDRFIKHASTFLGPDRWFIDWIEGDPEKKEGGENDKPDFSHLKDDWAVRELGLI